jgi:hypothetical protein
MESNHPSLAAEKKSLLLERELILRLIIWDDFEIPIVIMGYDTKLIRVPKTTNTALAAIKNEL